MAKHLGTASFGEAVYAMNFLAESDDFYSELKELAKSDISVLKNLVNLQKLYRGDDPQLSGKESALAVSVVLHKLYASNPKAAHYLGKMNWEPELVNWVGFLDQVGDQTFAQFLGIQSAADIPIGQASGVGDGSGGAESDLVSALGGGEDGEGDEEFPEEDEPDDAADELAAALDN